MDSVNVLLPLDANERRVSFIDEASGRPLTFIFQRITTEMWSKFFSAIFNQAEQDGKGGRIESFDLRTASIELVDRALTDVEGYRLPEGKELKALANWKNRVKYGHKIAAAALLYDISVTEQASEFDIIDDFETVTLEAAWGSATPGSMVRYSGLEHRFTPPTAEHQREFNRAMARALVVGGSRTGKTRWIGRQSALVSLYDKLIIAVSGYSVNGNELASEAFGESTREAIVREMDAYHKLAAVQELFSDASVSQKKEEQAA